MSLFSRCASPPCKPVAYSLSATALNAFPASTFCADCSAEIEFGLMVLPPSLIGRPFNAFPVCGCPARRLESGLAVAVRGGKTSVRSPAPPELFAVTTSASALPPLVPTESWILTSGTPSSSLSGSVVPAAYPRGTSRLALWPSLKCDVMTAGRLSTQPRACTLPDWTARLPSSQSCDWASQPACNWLSSSKSANADDDKPVKAMIQNVILFTSVPHPSKINPLKPGAATGTSVRRGANW